MKNISFADAPDCGCKSWLDHWTKEADQWLICCAEYSCTNPIYQAALVQNAEYNDENWYVVPLCKKHGRYSEMIDVGNLKLIKAAPNKNCRQ